MSRYLVVLVLALVSITFSPAQASSKHAQAQDQMDGSTSTSTQQPDLVSFGLGYMDFDKSESHKQSADFRLEYRWGMSLLPMISQSLNVDRYVQVHPFAGVETTSLGALYGLGGFALDAYLCRHVVFTWSEGVGLFSPGAMKPLGSVVEFRSSGELGWRFDNDMRATIALSHISNAGITKRNPGAEIAGVYLHVPTSTLFGN
jgi:hypothetical protein